MKHICAAMFEEKKRMVGLSINLDVHISHEDDYPTLYHRLTELDDDRHISIASIDVIYCPYCGVKLLEKKE